MHRERILAKNLFAFNQASSSTFPAAENTGNKERNERRKKNKHKQKSHKRGTANETNHEARETAEEKKKKEKSNWVEKKLRRERT